MRIVTILRIVTFLHNIFKLFVRMFEYVFKLKVELNVVKRQCFVKYNAEIHAYWKRSLFHVQQNYELEKTDLFDVDTKKHKLNLWFDCKQNALLSKLPPPRNDSLAMHSSSLDPSYYDHHVQSSLKFKLLFLTSY